MKKGELMAKRKLEVNEDGEILGEVKALIAKRDFVIHQNEVHIEIKAGQDLADLEIPERFFENLKTEGVI